MTFKSVSTHLLTEIKKYHLRSSKDVLKPVLVDDSVGKAWPQMVPITYVLPEQKVHLQQFVSVRWHLELATDCFVIVTASNSKILDLVSIRFILKLLSRNFWPLLVLIVMNNFIVTRESFSKYGCMEDNRFSSIKIQ